MDVAQFTDAAGRVWIVRISVAALRRVHDAMGLNLMSVATDQAARDAFFADPLRLGDALWCLCQPQALERGLSDVEFGELLEGDAMDAAVEALVDALVFFSPKDQRTVLSALVATNRRAKRLVAERAIEQLAAISVESIADQVTAPPAVTMPPAAQPPADTMQTAAQPPADTMQTAATMPSAQAPPAGGAGSTSSAA